MRYLNRILVAGNAAVLAMLLAFAAPAGAQSHITGPSSSYGTCCKTHVEGGGFCCTNCCLGKRTCISDYDPACKKATEVKT